MISRDLAAQSRPQRFPGRGLITFLIVALLGPLVGGLVLTGPSVLRAVMGMERTFPNAGTGLDIDTVAGVSWFIAVFSYIMGGFQALVSGLLLVIPTFLRGRFTLIEALGAAVIATVVFAIFYSVALPADTAGESTETSNAGLLAMLGGLGVISAFICQFILARVFKALDRRQKRLEQNL